MERNRQKYVQLSLAGKWLKMAREIILDNPGIEESRFIEMAAPLMPTHIQRRGGRKSGQVELAIASINHLTTVCKTVVLMDGKLTSKPRDNSANKGYTKEIVGFAASNGTVTAKDLTHIKYLRDLAAKLCDRGVLKKVSPGVFAIAEVQHDAT